MEFKEIDLNDHLLHGVVLARAHVLHDENGFVLGVVNNLVLRRA